MRIQVLYGSGDYQLMKKVVNQGIDAHLEGFTQSTFTLDTAPSFFKLFNFDFHDSELPILIRRLREYGSENADLWAADIEAVAAGEV